MVLATYVIVLMFCTKYFSEAKSDKSRYNNKVLYYDLFSKIMYI